MATLEDRKVARDFAGLINQTIAAVCIATVCVTGFEILRRIRRGRGLKRRPGDDPLGSVETWELGYLYQGRSWAEKASPPHSRWVLGWIWQAITFPEDKMLELVGIDATLYCRFLRGCFYFMLLQTFTTLPVLLPIHIFYSPQTISLSSLARGSIASLVQGGEKSERLLAVHVVCTLWIAVSWVCVLLWVSHGAIKFREKTIRAAAAEFALEDADVNGPPPPTRGLRLRTIMVSNIPMELRTDQLLRDYFEYYLSHPHEPAGTAGSFNGIVTFIATRIGWFFRTKVLKRTDAEEQEEPPVVEKVVVMRKMTDLASLMERREDVLRKLEAAHVNLAKKTLLGVKEHLTRPGSTNLILEPKPRPKSRFRRRNDLEAAPAPEPLDEKKMKTLVTTLAPFLEQFNVGRPDTHPEQISAYATIWDALYALPRTCLNPYQPLINLSSLFQGTTVPAIDYYTAKLGLLTALVHEKRSRQHEEFEAASTAFVTFSTPADARRALEALPSHPRNPLECVAVLAPDYEDLDWARVMKRALKTEFVTDYIVNLGVWTFTCSWIFPVSLFVGLFNIQNIATQIPFLDTYMERHPNQETVLSGLLPTILVSLLSLFIPMLLLLIGKKAHTIITFSKLHDRIMTRYHKFLQVNVLIFFCAGVSALESFLTSFRQYANPIPLISASFSTAGPFYVGWFIFQTAMHAGLEIGLYGLPLLVYPGTRSAKTLRRRFDGTKPRTFNFYYWLPNHVLAVTVALLFACLTPLVLPFALLYFAVAAVIIKNQLLHVYSKKYENDGKIILIRIVRYSLDGVMLAQVVLMAFMILQQRYPQAAFLALFIAVTATVKLYLTRRIRAVFRKADELEAEVHCGTPMSDIKDDKAALEEDPNSPTGETKPAAADLEENVGVPMPSTRLVDHPGLEFLTWRMPAGINFSYSSVPVRSNLHRAPPRKPIPFAPVLREQKVHSPDVAQWRQTVGPLESSQILNQDDPRSSKRDPGVLDEPTAIVTVHEKKKPWDDRPRLDRPYLNPYYATPLDNFLWLPLNPFGVLDLDESADLHHALTSEPRAGKLGVWLSDTATVASDVVPSIEPTPSNSTIRREISGQETIVGLPEGIEHRARVEQDIEQAEGARLTMGHRGTVRLRATPRTHVHQQRHVDEHERPRVFVEVDPTRTGGESIVSARDAVLGEILVEEQLATEERLRKEHAEEMARRSRLWAWTRG